MDVSGTKGNSNALGVKKMGASRKRWESFSRCRTRSAKHRHLDCRERQWTSATRLVKWRPGMMNKRTEPNLLAWLVAAGCLLGACLAHAADGNTSPAFFNQSIQPILTEYCLKCHSTEKQKGDLDLERFPSLSEVKRHPKIWQGVTSANDSWFFCRTPRYSMRASRRKDCG